MSTPTLVQKEARLIRATLVAAALVIVSQPIFMSNGTVFSASVLAIAALCFVSTRGQSSIPLGLVGFAAWALLSVAWTHDRSGYPYAVIALLGTAGIAVCIATYNRREILFGLVAASTLVMMISVGLGYAAPNLARMTSAFQSDALIGIYSNKNSLATILVVGVTACLGLLATAKRKLPLLALVGLHFLALFETKSSSGVVVAVLLVVSFVLVQILFAVTPRVRLGAIFIAAVAVGGFVVPWIVGSAEEIAQGLGRDLTLTGRTEIWRIVLDRIGHAPSLGYGWGGVWRSDVGSSIQSEFGSIAANSAHNGYLEIALQLGVTGLILYAAVLIPAIVRSWRLALWRRDHQWISILLTTLIIYSLTEARSAQPIGLFIICIAAGAALKAGPDRSANNTDRINPVLPVVRLRSSRQQSSRCS